MVPIVILCYGMYMVNRVFFNNPSISLNYWLDSIERDMRNMEQSKRYISLEQFGQELMAAVSSKI